MTSLNSCNTFYFIFSFSLIFIDFSIGFLLIWISLSLCRTGSGTFKDGDLLVNRDGVRIVSNSEVEVVRRLIFSSISLTFLFWVLVILTAFLTIGFCYILVSDVFCNVMVPLSLF